jgi:hypothetical protein
LQHAFRFHAAAGALERLAAFRADVVLFQQALLPGCIERRQRLRRKQRIHQLDREIRRDKALVPLGTLHRGHAFDVHAHAVLLAGQGAERAQRHFPVAHLATHRIDFHAPLLGAPP